MTVEEVGNRRYLYPDENMVLTDWNREDIKEFTFAKIQIILPISYDYSSYYEITNEECEQLEQQQLEILRNERENR